MKNQTIITSLKDASGRMKIYMNTPSGEIKEITSEETIAIFVRELACHFRDLVESLDVVGHEGDVKNVYTLLEALLSMTEENQTAWRQLFLDEENNTTKEPKSNEVKLN